MSEIQLAHFSFGGERVERSRFHEVALRDARIAAEHAAGADQPVNRIAGPGLVSRIRLALAGSAIPPIEACDCVA